MITIRAASMHLEREQIQRVLHGELGPAAEPVERHLAACRVCREAVEGARQEEASIYALLESLDGERRPVQLAAVKRQARGVARRGIRRWAAGVIAAAGLAGVAYAVPSSPLRALIARMQREAPPAVAIGDSSSHVGVSAASELTTVSVASGNSVVVAIAQAQPGMTLRIELADVVEVSVSGPAAARYSVGPARVLVESAGEGGEYHVVVPRRAPRVEVTLEGRRVWLKEGERVEGEWTVRVEKR